MLIRLESPPRWFDQILNCQSFAVAPIFWDPAVGFTSQDCGTVLFQVLRNESHKSWQALRNLSFHKRRQYNIAEPVSPVISNVGLPQVNE